MSTQFKNDTIISDYKVTLQPSQVVVEAKLKTENAAGIAKILSVNADSRIVSFETLSGEAAYNGRVTFKVMYADDSGSCACLDYNADFSDKIAAAAITPNSGLKLEANVIDTNSSVSGSDTIKVSCVVEIRGMVVAHEKMEISAGDLEDVYTRTEIISYNMLSSGTTNEFVLTDEISINEAVERICMSEAGIYITEARPILDSVLYTGKIVTNIMYVPSEGMLTSKQTVTEFSQEIACLGARENTLLDYHVSIDKWQIKAETYEGEGKSMLNFEYKIAVATDVYQNMEKEVIVDAFCINNELSINAESWNISKHLDAKLVNCKIDGTAELTEGMPMIDRVLGVCGSRMNVANCYTDTDRLVVEGVLNTNVIYFNKEFESTNSVAVEIPYSLSLPYPDMASDNIVTVKPCITDLTARNTHSAVEIVAHAALQTTRSINTNAYCVKELVKGEQKNLDLNAIAIYIAKPNQTLWDISKALSSTPELLMRQNPTLSSPLKGGEKVIIYRQL